MQINRSKLKNGYFFKINALLIFSLLGLVIQGCEPSTLEVKNLEVSDSENNLLRKIISFETTVKTNSKLMLWNDRDTTFFEKEGKELKDHSYKLKGLIPDYKYQFIVLVGNDLDSIQSDVLNFKTKKLPDYFPQYNVEVDSGNVFDGYLMLRHARRPAMQVMINSRAEIVWYQEFDTVVFRPSRITDRESIIAIENTQYIREFDFEGKTLFDLNKGEKGFDKLLHHDILRRNDTILVLTREKKVYDLTSIGGGKADTVRSDGILGFNAEGDKIWEWSIFDVANPLEYNIELKETGDWGHANSLSIDALGNYLISFRLFNQVWNIDSKSGEILWKLGVGGDFKFEENDYFKLQHAAHIDKNGHLTLFDNGIITAPISRSLTYELDARQRPNKLLKKIILPDSLHTFKMGSSYVLPNDNFLICASTKQKLLIMNNQGNVLWMVSTSKISYRANYVDKF